MRRRQSVAHPMSNARRKRAKRTTSVVVPMVAWSKPDHLNVTRGNQQLQLRRALRDVGKLHGKVSMSLQVHARNCPWSVVLWPRASDCAADDDEMLHAIERRDENCKCTPLIMYTGAMA